MPIGAPLPAAPPCILQRRLPRTAGDRHGFPLPPGNRGLVEPEKKSGSDTSSFSQRDTSPEQQNCDGGVLLILLSALHTVEQFRT